MTRPEALVAGVALSVLPFAPQAAQPPSPCCSADSASGWGFWFVTVSRSRSDGLSGFVGRVIRGKVH